MKDDEIESLVQKLERDFSLQYFQAKEKMKKNSQSTFAILVIGAVFCVFGAVGATDSSYRWYFAVAAILFALLAAIYYWGVVSIAKVAGDFVLRYKKSTSALGPRAESKEKGK